MYMKMAIAGLLLCMASFSVSAEERVFEMKTYTAAAGKMDALHARFRDHTVKLFAKHGMTVVGFWMPEGKADTLIYILSYASKEAGEKSWAEFRKDPEWEKAKAASEVNGKLVDNAVGQILKPTDYSVLK